MREPAQLGYPFQSLTMNHPDVCKCGHINGPAAAYLHTTHVPPRVRLLQVVHGYREHLLDLVINNTDFILGWVGHDGLARPSQTGAELPHAPLTPVLYVAGILGFIMAREFDGLTLQDDQLASGGHMAEELCWKKNRTAEISWFYPLSPLFLFQFTIYSMLQFLQPFVNFLLQLNIFLSWIEAHYWGNPSGLWGSPKQYNHTISSYLISVAFILK